MPQKAYEYFRRKSLICGKRAYFTRYGWLSKIKKMRYVQ